MKPKRGHLVRPVSLDDTLTGGPHIGVVTEEREIDNIDFLIVEWLTDCPLLHLWIPEDLIVVGKASDYAARAEIGDYAWLDKIIEAEADRSSTIQTEAGTLRITTVKDDGGFKAMVYDGYGVVVHITEVLGSRGAAGRAATAAIPDVVRAIQGV